MAKTHSIQPFPTDIDRIVFGHWLSGFTDGEGCFLLYSSPPLARARFLINLRFDDFPILQTIQSYFSCGILSEKLASPSRHLWNPQVRFYIDKPCDLMDYVIPHFETFPLRAKKAADFIIWSNGVRLLHRIGSRKRRSRGFGKGTYPVWMPEERSDFSLISQELKKQRRFT